MYAVSKRNGILWNIFLTNNWHDFDFCRKNFALARRRLDGWTAAALRPVGLSRCDQEDSDHHRHQQHHHHHHFGHLLCHRLWPHHLSTSDTFINSVMNGRSRFPIDAGSSPLQSILGLRTCRFWSKRAFCYRLSDLLSFFSRVQETDVYIIGRVSLLSL